MRAGGVAVALALALGLAGCASPDYPTSAPAPPEAPATPAAPPPVVAPPPAPRLASPVPRPQSRSAQRDACGATDMQGMIGKSRTLIPVPVDPNRQRVACTSCKLSDDVDPGRLNFLFNAHTGLIEQVRCG